MSEDRELQFKLELCKIEHYYDQLEKKRFGDNIFSMESYAPIYFERMEKERELREKYKDLSKRVYDKEERDYRRGFRQGFVTAKDCPNTDENLVLEWSYGNSKSHAPPGTICYTGESTDDEDEENHLQKSTEYDNI